MTINAVLVMMIHNLFQAVNGKKTHKKEKRELDVKCSYDDVD